MIAIKCTAIAQAEIKVLKKLIDGGDIIYWKNLPLELQETMFEICRCGWARTFSETETFHITEAGKKVYANRGQ